MSAARGASGRLVERGDAALVQAAAAHLGCDARPPRALARVPSRGEFVRLGGLEAYLKASGLRGKHSLRHGLRRLLGLAVPRLREYDNLAWLRAHGFGAARPLAAGCVLAAGRPVFQFLATERVAGARTLREVLAGRGGAEDRGALLDELADTVARLHEARFVHRDLFPRNVLVAPTAGAQGGRLLLLDAWRGGPGPSLRGAVHDLACWMLHAPDLMDPAEQRRWLARYFDRRASLGSALDRAAWTARVARLRRGMVRRLQRRGRTQPPIPPLTWNLGPETRERG